MSETSPLMSAGLGIIILCVILVVGGLLFIQTYESSITAVGSHVVYTNYSVDICEQDLPNESSTCGGLSTGTIDNTTWTGITGATNAFDKDWITNSTDFVNATEAVLEFNYDIPANTTSAILETKWDNATGTPTLSNTTLSATNCRNTTGTYAVAINMTANASYGVYCINGSGEYTILGGIDMPNESFQFFEQKIWWSINKSHSNYTAAASPIINNVYSDMGTALTTFSALLPLMALAIVGGFAIFLVLTHFGRETA